MPSRGWALPSRGSMRECPVCLESWQAGVTEPLVMIPCGHTLCQGCKKRVVTCPICKGDVQGAVVNYALLGMNESSDTGLNHPPLRAPGRGCPHTHGLTHWCTEHHVPVCRTCAANPSRHHLHDCVVPISNARRSLTQQLAAAPVHSSESSELLLGVLEREGSAAEATAIEVEARIDHAFTQLSAMLKARCCELKHQLKDMTAETAALIEQRCQLFKSTRRITLDNDTDDDLAWLSAYAAQLVERKRGFPSTDDLLVPRVEFNRLELDELKQRCMIAGEVTDTGVHPKLCFVSPAGLLRGVCPGKAATWELVTRDWKGRRRTKSGQPVKARMVLHDVNSDDDAATLPDVEVVDRSDGTYSLSFACPTELPERLTELQLFIDLVHADGKLVSIGSSPYHLCVRRTCQGRLVGSLVEHGVLKKPGGMARLPGDNVAFVVDQANQRVVALDMGNGALLGVVGSQGHGAGDFQAPWDLVLDMEEGHQMLYVVDQVARAVKVFDLQYGPSRAIYARQLKCEDGEGERWLPTGVVAHEGSVYVGNATEGCVVVMDKLTGRLKHKLGRGKLKRPTCLVKDVMMPAEATVLYVADQGLSCVIAIKTESNMIIGTYSADVGTQRGLNERSPRSVLPYGLAIDHECLYVADWSGGVILVFDKANKKLSRRLGENGLRHPWGVVLKEDGRLYVSDAASHQILMYQ